MEVILTGEMAAWVGDARIFCNYCVTVQSLFLFAASESCWSKNGQLHADLRGHWENAAEDRKKMSQTRDEAEQQATRTL